MPTYLITLMIMLKWADYHYFFRAYGGTCQRGRAYVLFLPEKAPTSHSQ